jgi:two-component system response regulator AtoC
MPHALIVDDDPDVVGWLQEVARLEGFTSTGVQTLQAAREQLSRKRPDVVLTDLRLPDGEGIELARELPPGDAPELIVVTGHASVDSAIAALRAGATDYLVKPAELDRVQAVLRHARKTAALRNEIGALRHELRRLGRFGRLLGSAPAMELLYDQMGRVAPTSATVLLLGETGTGKELAALTLHELSRRREAPFLPLNCGAVSPQLIESELFGHERGSFTGADRQHKGFFERAHGGTVFLDEVTEMPMELQVKLLRVLETGSFSRVGGVTPIVCDVRIIAASNREPELALADGKLREDLYHRLNVFPIRLPPLRQRGADIELLARHFLAELNRTERTTKTFSSDSLASLYQHGWPGNVRELRNHVQRAFIMADDVIDSGLPTGAATAASDDATTVTIRVGTPLEEVERRVTLATLAQCGHVKRKAADILGVSLKTLYNRLEVYNGRSGAEPEGVAEAADPDAARPAAAQHQPGGDRWS